MTILAAALLGIVQGVTEFLPISSTAHLLVLGQLLGFEDPVFTVMIQFGSILAIMWLYRSKIMAVIAGLWSTPEARHFALAISIGTIPALLAGALLAGYVKSVLYQSPNVFATAFILGGLVMLAVEKFRPEPTVLDAEATPLPRALGIGLCQVLALIPGVSRSGATIVGGLMMRLDRPAAAEFSFFLAMPIMMAAFVHELFEVRHELSSARGLEIGVGLTMAFVSSLVIIKPFLGFVRRAGFVPFAWYRIAIGLLLIGAAAQGWVRG
ncbi:MAG TPA: undecaprenyl-diphosphate phosphatase [Vicinamibacterales bacterium]|nr:undecaprenyl-diphosphate phosphatase [Vicinamibacterales bacterium]